LKNILEPRAHAAFGAAARAATFERLRQTIYDVVVVGGGITGVGVARDAALRGLRVALLEQADFAAGTSSKSSKLLHGGVRYLEQYEFKLVWEACRERAALCRLVPHLARPLQFLFPLYQGHPVSLNKLDLGLWLYDAMAGLQNLGFHSRLNANAMRDKEPGLRADGLNGGAAYYDAVTDDARLVVENARAAWEAGADVLNYALVTEFRQTEQRVEGVRVVDATLADSEPIDVRAHCVVNASGPWSDALRKQLGRDRPLLRPTKGVHVVVPRRLFSAPHAVVMTSPADHRILFVIPWGPLALIGTTDTDVPPGTTEVRAERADIDYILDILKWYFPQVEVKPGDILSTYAGLRPLVADGAASASSTSREHRILEDKLGLLTVAGGKLTTYRSMAAQIVDEAVSILRRDGHDVEVAASRTARLPLVPPNGSAPPSSLPEALRTRLRDVYGSRASEVGTVLTEQAEAHGEGALALITPEVPDARAQAVYAARHEMVVHLDDFMARRSQAHFAGATVDEAAAVCELLATELGWDKARQQAELERYQLAWRDSNAWRDVLL
jgi:glycerol-3-phosphate dehydrogenase